MTDDEIHETHSQTVLQVIDKFVAELRADDGIQDAATDRLDALLRREGVPKHDELNVALFEQPADDKE